MDRQSQIRIRVKVQGFRNRIRQLDRVGGVGDLTLGLLMGKNTSVDRRGSRPSVSLIVAKDPHDFLITAATDPDYNCFDRSYDSDSDP